MPCAWIISIGDELLAGRVINWNAYWIAKRLTGLGIHVTRIICIPDDVEAIKETIVSALQSNVDYIFTTGGLGPTPGDVTLEGIAGAINRKLRLDERALEYVRRRYEELYELGLVEHKNIDSSRKKMAFIPEGADVIYNDVGVAPGVVIRHGKTMIFVLPGVPSEAMYLFEKIVPRIAIEKHVEVVEDFIAIRDESKVSSVLEDVRRSFPDVSIKTYPTGFGERKMRIIAIGTDRERIVEAIHRLKKMLKD